jgi:transposase-like protein
MNNPENNQTIPNITCPRCEKSNYDARDGNFKPSKDFKCRECNLEWSQLVK